MEKDEVVVSGVLIVRSKPNKKYFFCHFTAALNYVIFIIMGKEGFHKPLDLNLNLRLNSKNFSELLKLASPGQTEG